MKLYNLLLFKVIFSLKLYSDNNYWENWKSSFEESRNTSFTLYIFKTLDNLIYSVKCIQLLELQLRISFLSFYWNSRIVNNLNK